MENHNTDCWTPLRRNLREWFERNAPSLGELYEGAVFMVYSDNFPGRVRFVAHAVREIGNRLPDIVAGREGRPRLEYKNRLDNIQQSWERAGFPLDGSIPAKVVQDSNLLPSGHIPVPLNLFQQIANLIRDHASVRETRKQSTERLLKALVPNSCESEAFLMLQIEKWLEILDWFMSQVHESPDKQDWNDAEMHDELRKRFETF